MNVRRHIAARQERLLRGDAARSQTRREEILMAPNPSLPNRGRRPTTSFCDLWRQTECTRSIALHMSLLANY
jgi:hypothetical protein